jgi:hypothetical protein
MDQLFKRYADPFLFLNGYIRTNRFDEFVESFVERIGKERDEKAQWEFYLHKVEKGSFAEFVKSLKKDKENQKMSEQTIETTLKDSINILKNFKPN